MLEEFVTISQQLENANEAIALFGIHDAHLKRLEEELGVSIVTRGETVSVSGTPEQVQLVDDLLRNLLIIIRPLQAAAWQIGLTAAQYRETVRRT